MDIVNQVTVIGAGPAGLMLACTLARYGIQVTILDDRPSSTATGRADGLQPKTIETLKQLGLADSLLERGVKINIEQKSTADKKLHRTAREIHYPKDIVDLLDPNLLLIHQGMIEDVFIQDLKVRGVEVQRNSSFVGLVQPTSENEDIVVKYKDVQTGEDKFLKTKYLVGCDGAHSNVRKCIDGAEMEGDQSGSVWGILDAVIETKFPDLWSKAIVQSEKGAILSIPRERNMTRLYIELQDTAEENSKEVVQDFVMKRAEEIFSPYKLTWKRIEWFAVYRFGQRAAKRFSDNTQRVFIVGDAAHNHSPKAAQGMNVSMHDSFNLSWKLALTIKSVALPCLLETYTQERQAVAQDLLAFDFEHANAYSAGDPIALAENFAQNIRFISGLAEYGKNVLNPEAANEITKPKESKIGLSDGTRSGVLRPGALLPPAKVTRYIDANPVDLQLDIPLLGQFRIFFFIPDVHRWSSCLEYIFQRFSNLTKALDRTSVAANSFTQQETELDEYNQPTRYIGVSKLFTYALVTGMDKEKFEIADLPISLQESSWTIYVDDIPQNVGDSRLSKESYTHKWVGDVKDDEIVVLNVRPDGYVGSLKMFCMSGGGSEDVGAEVAKWLEDYYGEFLKRQL
ncbi:putative phenol 2-monooxygenase protein [Botrytis cinerea BcDW1]|uniref:Putative phenol 2-monooxygenase protein n=1 Tax=Botryotinia fuckeliana (strain BcDW1) TaxID=1290391 RepID=M7UKD5_BOTF1|nr:putative phenol 2-monooxygenase protein [Botrytis cinerea BcDW1]